MTSPSLAVCCLPVGLPSVVLLVIWCPKSYKGTPQVTRPDLLPGFLSWVLLPNRRLPLSFPSPPNLGPPTSPQHINPSEARASRSGDEHRSSRGLHTRPLTGIPGGEGTALRMMPVILLESFLKRKACLSCVPSTRPLPFWKALFNI